MNRNKALDTAKAIALIGMFVSHFFYPWLPYGRALMQWVFPLFAFSVGLAGLEYTRNKSLYAKRVLLVGIFAQIPHAIYFMPMGIPWYWPNVCISYAAALWVVGLCKHLPHIKLNARWFYLGYPVHFLVLYWFFRGIGVYQ